MVHPLEEILRRHFGITDDLRETGYILSDGTFIDLSGRHYTSDYVRRGGRFVPKRGRDWQAGHRHVDHRELPDEIRDAVGKREGTDAMIEFLIRTGALRANPSVGFIVYAMPSVEAVDAFVKGWKRAYGDQPVIVDVHKPDVDVESFEFEHPTVEGILAAIEPYFEGRSPSMGAAAKDPFTLAVEAAMRDLRLDDVVEKLRREYRISEKQRIAEITDKGGFGIPKGPKEWTPKAKSRAEELERAVEQDREKHPNDVTLYIMFDSLGALLGWKIDYPDYWHGHSGPMATVYGSDSVDYEEIRSEVEDALHPLDWDEIKEKLEDDDGA